MEVKIIRNGYGYKIGAIVTMSYWLARLLIKKGYAKETVHVPAPKPVIKKKSKK